MIQQYVDWWNVHGFHGTRTVEDATAEGGASGIGNSTFFTMKKIIGSLLTIAITPLDSSRTVVDQFMRDA